MKTEKNYVFLAEHAKSLKRMKKIENKVLSMKSASLSYEFARYVKGADIKAHEEIILEKNSSFFSGLFAHYVEGANIKAHEKKILDSKDPRSCLDFAKYVKGADIKVLEQVVLDDRSANYSYEFAKCVEGADIKAHEKIVLESKNLTYNYLFAKDIKGADINKHVQIILDSKDLNAIRNFLFTIRQQKETKYNKKLETQTLAIIKPDGMKHINEILEMIYKNGLKIIKIDVKNLNEEILSKHYSHLIDKPFYPKLKEYMMSGPVAIMILEGYNSVEKLRDLMGPTDSTKAPKGTIRGNFGTDITYNVIHGSDSNENAEIEINRFFKQKQKRI